MDFKQLARTLQRRWVTIVAMLVVALGIASLVSFVVMDTQYESEAKIFVSADSQSITETVGASYFVQTRITSYAELADHEQVLRQVAAKLGDNAPDDLAGAVSAEAEATSVILTVKAHADTPELAQQIAAAESEVLAEYIREIETPRGQERSQITTTITNEATYDDKPSSPKLLLNFAAAGVIGLLLGIALAIVRDILDHTLKSFEDVSRVAGAPVMASVAFDKSVQRQPLLSDVHGFSPRAEAFRLLRTNLQYLDLDEQPKCLVISSPVPGEGKTSTSTNLAVALAQAGKRVLLLDGDLRRPRIADLLGLESRVGLTTVLVGKSTLAESIQIHQPTGLSFLAGGPIPPNPTEVLQAAATRALIQRVREMYDIVIIDAPPLLPVADAAILAHAADGALLICRHGKTTEEELAGAAARFETVGARLFGVVVNMVPRRAREGYSYYYYEDEQLLNLSDKK
ncbi:polysaccharide biosynthesis tyrosine autokinase [Nocardioides daejeonensis]|uniref:polysaccharide biosynthesis tyrosine autokinase n=1 Tax=Nocardioides daejeonensis TaxID=1046556 RepID=UPI000D74A3C0|nr:polysaccharide biosynthesis tyrosine autokinase [Nocardioides daejeonensis]